MTDREKQLEGLLRKAREYLAVHQVPYLDEFDDPVIKSDVSCARNCGESARSDAPCKNGAGYELALKIDQALEAPVATERTRPHIHYSVGFGDCRECVDRETKLAELHADAVRGRDACRE